MLSPADMDMHVTRGHDDAHLSDQASCRLALWRRKPVHGASGRGAANGYIASRPIRCLRCFAGTEIHSG